MSLMGVRGSADGAQRGNSLFGLTFEHVGPGHHHVCSGFHHEGQGFFVDASVNLDIEIHAGIFGIFAQLANLWQHLGDKLLPAEARLHTPDRDLFKTTQNVFDGAGRSGWIQRNPGLGT